MKRRSEWVIMINIVLGFCLVSSNCQYSRVNDPEQNNGTKIVGLQDPSVDPTVKSALENGTVSEIVVRKDLLLFPVNAPNLVIAHRQEIHAVPQNNGTVDDNGKPSAAEVAEVNEYSLSQVVSNDTTKNETEIGDTGEESASVRDTQNDTLLEPGKLLEIPSGFNLTNGLATEKVTLPPEVQNISVPKQSIVDLLSKSLQSTDPSLTTRSFRKLLYKRSIDDENNEETEQSSTSTGTTANTMDNLVDYGAMAKRSIDEEKSTTITTSTTEKPDEADVEKRDVTNDSTTNAEIGERSTTDSGVIATDKSVIGIFKRSIDDNDDDGDDDDSSNDSNDDEDVDDNDSKSTTEFYDQEINKMNNTIDDEGKNNELTNENDDQYENGKRYVRDDDDDGMDVAEDIVFRPLFRYRQETRLRQQYSSERRNDYRRDRYHRYKNNDYADYD